MRELNVFFPDSSIKANGFGTIASNLRSRGLDSIEVLSCNGDRAKFRLQLQESLDCTRMRENNSIKTIERISQSPPEYLMVVTPYMPWSFMDDCPSSLICEHDFTVRENGLEISLIAPQSLITEINAFIVEGDISCEVLSIGSYDGVSEEPMDSLSDQQQDVLLYAYRQGYYSIPRKQTLSELADDLELDKSTISEILRRAENNTFAQLLDKQH